MDDRGRSDDRSPRASGVARHKMSDVLDYCDLAMLQLPRIIPVFGGFAGEVHPPAERKSRRVQAIHHRRCSASQESLVERGSWADGGHDPQVAPRMDAAAHRLPESGA